MTDRPRVIYVLGAGHCGSTLLGLLLNGHPACLGVSELSKLAESIAANDPVLDTAPWREAARGFEATTGAPFATLDLGHPSWRTFARWTDTEVATWARPRAALVDCLARATDKPWIVDATKSWQPLYLMQRSGLFDLRVVHLLRDVRGVAHSYLTKYGDLRHGLRKWLKPNVAAMALGARFGDHWLRVRYEDLAADPEATLARVCALAGLRYDPAMRRFRDHAWLGIGGNRMAARTDDTIRVDERWKRELSWKDRVVVGVVGGALNRYYGYRP